MNDLPAGWRWVTPDEITGGRKSNLVIGPFGSNLKVSDYQDSGIPLVFVRNIRSRNFPASATRFISESKARELHAHEARTGDVLITKMGDPPGDSCVYTGCTAIITADCIRLRPTGNFLPHFVSLAFESPVGRSQILQITRGIAQKKVSLARFRSGIKIPAPSLAEQARIVEILEDQLSHLDAGNAILVDARQRLGALEAAALDETRDGVVAPLAELATIQGGIQKQPKRTPSANAYPFLRVANVTKYGLDLSDVHQIELFDGELRRLRLQQGDLLVVEGNGSSTQVGRAALWDGSIADCVYQNHLIRVRPNARLLPDYLEAVWNSPRNRRQLTDLASSSSGLHTLSVSKLKSILIPVPPLPRQRDLVEHVADFRYRGSRLNETVTISIAKITGLRSTLLQAAFSGRPLGTSGAIESIAEMAGV